MLDPLVNLSEGEREELYLVPAWVSLLIAGADDVFSKKEIKKAIRLAEDKSQEENAFISEFYKNIARKIEANLRGYIAVLPKEREKRTDFLVKKLTTVNELFKKIELDYAHQLYLSFRDYAYQVAQASGGLFGLLSVSYAESKFIDLRMIDDPAQVKT